MRLESRDIVSRPQVPREGSSGEGLQLSGLQQSCPVLQFFKVRSNFSMECPCVMGTGVGREGSYSGSAGQRGRWGGGRITLTIFVIMEPHVLSFLCFKVPVLGPDHTSRLCQKGIALGCFLD